MHVYNAIIVLKEILPLFPVSSVHEISGMMLSRAIEKFLEKEERGDLKILGRAYVILPAFPLSHLTQSSIVITRA